MLQLHYQLPLLQINSFLVEKLIKNKKYTMDPITNNQMNSMYQAPLGQQPVHRTSIVSIIVLLVIAIIVAVLGFGRINSMKEEQAKMIQKESEQARMIQMEAKATAAAKADEASILTDLENVSSETNAGDIAEIEAAF